MSCAWVLIRVDSHMDHSVKKLLARLSIPLITRKPNLAKLPLLALAMTFIIALSHRSFIDCGILRSIANKEYATC